MLPLLPDEQLGDIFVALARLPALLGQHPCCTEAFELVAQYLTPQVASYIVYQYSDYSTI